MASGSCTTPPPSCPVRPSRDRSHRHERGRGHGHEKGRGQGEHGQAQARTRAGQGQGEIGNGEADGGRGQGEGDGIAVERGGRTRQQGAQRGRARGQHVVVQKAPAEDARRVVGGEVPRGQEKEAGTTAPSTGTRGGRPSSYLPPAVGGVMRAPHAQTMLRVRHSMRRSRPQAVQPRYVPEGRAG